MAADFTVSLVMLALVGTFAAQRRYMTPFGGIFPDAVLVGLALLCVLLLARTVYTAWRVRGQAPPSLESGSAGPEDASEPVSHIVLTLALLTAWLWVFWTLGFVVGGVLGFIVLAVWLAPQGRSSWRLWLRSLVAGAAWVLSLYAAFGRILGVPLPFGWWAGRF